MSGTFNFIRCTHREWNGRYRITKADENVFHIKYNRDFSEWWPYVSLVNGYDIGYCPALELGDVRKLVNYINMVKLKYHFGEGGSFIINEFHQVIVPTIGDEKVLVGEINGKILFKNVFNDEEIDLSDTAGISSGDPWTKPYIGTVFNYNPRSGILFQEKKGAHKEYPTKKDLDLENKLYNIRNGDYCRFLVNPWGVVLTKKTPYLYNGEWQPVYVGRINYDSWFDKEE